MPPKDLEARITKLEGEVRELRGRVRATEQGAAAARVLAGGAVGAEVRDFRNATTASFNALREDMVDMRQEMRAKFDVAAAGQQRIVKLIQTVIDAQGDKDSA